MTTVTRSHTFNTHQNKNKTHETLQVIKLRQEILINYSIEASELFLTTGQVPTFKPNIKKDSQGPQVVLRDCWLQVKNAYNTFIPQCKDYGRLLIKELELESDINYQLNILNKYGLWLQPEKVKKTIISQEAKELALLIFDLIKERFKARLPILGDRKTILICSSGALEKKKDPGSTFDYWLNFHGLRSRKPIKIPIKSNEYYEEFPGKRNGTVTLQWVEEEKKLQVIVSKTSEVKEYKPSKDTGLGIDWGFKSLFTTSDGRLLGLQVRQKLLDWDEKLVKLSSQLQKLGLALKSNKRYRKLQSRIREYVKNEVGRLLNQLYREGWASWNVESLDFRGKGYSKRMNRILQRAGRAVVSSKLKSMEETGLEVGRVNPAYTSQECSSCGFTHRLNRNGKLFKCKFCNLLLDSDVNAARNILRRSQEDNSWLFVRKNMVLGYLDEVFDSRWGLTPSLVVERLGLPARNS